MIDVAVGTIGGVVTLSVKLNVPRHRTRR